MNAKREKIELEIPSKAVHISHAACSNGCSLMDETVQIGGHPSIKAKICHAGQEGVINLDPVYGSFEHRCTIEVPAGAVVEFFCPRCGVSLKGQDTCNVCSSPTFVLHLPRGGVIEGCLRKGCFEHSLKIVDAEQLLKRLFDEHTLDAYL
ncbi:MAG: hypothetical protein QHJ34_05550 [bacterium]|jgi:predicted RNA-binding Zn-ribbon protein involved in translation (DUF1610 family)|nr:hypothetical protein [candidate division KSB1 bacterium]MDH7559683.1 hypothetical protein [bacterium]